MNWIRSSRHGPGAEIRRKHAASTLFVCVAALTFTAAFGCGGGGGGESRSARDGGGDPPDAGTDVGLDTADTTADSAPSPRPDQVLEPKGLAVTDALGIGAGREALERPVALSAASADDPTDEAPLPSEASAVGGFLELSAGRDVDAGDALLYLAVPVPTDARTANLALAVLTDDAGTAGVPSSPDTPVWTVVSGMYEPDHGLLVVPLRFLAAEGVTLALVESETYDASTLPSSSEPKGSPSQNPSQKGLLARDGDPTVAVRKAVEKATTFIESAPRKDDFYVVCRGFDGDGCGDADRDKVREQLRTIQKDFSSGFREPDLRRTLPDRTVEGTEGRFYRYVLRSKGSANNCSERDGLYSPLTRVAVTCHDASNESPPQASSTRMQYLRAVQFSYPFFDWRYPVEGPGAWLLEGPATFAKNPASTADEARRWDPGSGTDDLRHIDTPLTAWTGEPPYPAAGTQDFWVYMIERRNSSPKNVLTPLWETELGRAPSLQDVDASYNMTAEHWSWVRNQAFESRVAAANSDLNGTCVPNPDAWASLHRTLEHDTTDRRGFRSRLELSGDWRAGVVKIEFTNGFSNDRVRATVTGRSDSGYVRAYPAQSSPGKECMWRNEEPASTEISKMLDPGDTWVSYLLLSNSARNSSDKRLYDIAASFARPRSDQESPSVAIQRPPAADYPLKRDTLFLKADASDPGGGYVEPLEWTVTGSGGTSKTYTGDDLAIEDFWSDGFRPGTFTIEVYAKDDDGHESTVTVESEIEEK